MEITPELLEKYHLGRCSPQEKVAIEAWLHSEEYETYTGEEVSSAANARTGEAMWHDMAARISSQQTARQSGNASKQKTRNLLLTFCKIAALLIISLAVGWWQYQQRHGTSQSIRYKTYHAMAGKKMELTLADGTQVHLNGGSTLEVPVQFADTARLVRLHGEAYFDVTKDPRRVFYVESSKSRVEVLGTAFNIKDFEEELTSTIIVMAGKVRFSSLDEARENKVLTEGQAAQYSPAKQIEEYVADPNLISWKDQVLSFRNHTFKEIVPMLERWYGITVQVDNAKLMKSHYTGSYNNPSLHTLMEDLSFVLKFNYRITNKTLIIQ